MLAHVSAIADHLADVRRPPDRYRTAVPFYGSGARRVGAEGVGDVSFGQVETMTLFARGNLVTVILNAGPKTVSVVPAAWELDALIRQRLE